MVHKRFSLEKRTEIEKINTKVYGKRREKVFWCNKIPCVKLMLM